MKFGRVACCAPLACYDFRVPPCGFGCRPFLHDTMTHTSPAAPAVAPVLELSGVAKQFGPVRALSGVGLRLYAGEVHALMGQNGAGKSTLIKVLTGVYPADEGEMRLNGQPSLDGKSVHLWAQDHEGWLTMQATATLA